MGEYNIYLFKVKKHGGYIFHVAHYGTTEDDAREEVKEYLRQNNWTYIEWVRAVRHYDVNDGLQWNRKPLVMTGGNINE